MTASMLLPSQARERAQKSYDKGFAARAVDGSSVLDMPFAVGLWPPVEAVVLRDTAAVSAWISAWRAVERAHGAAAVDDADGLTVDWEARRWPSMGTQDVPVRLRISTPDALARFAGRGAHWRTATARRARLAAVVGDGPEVPKALAKVLPAVVGYEPDDVDRLTTVVAWLIAHPASGVFVRQVPARGIDTKWLERHRSVVTTLVTAVTQGSDLGLATRPGLIRVRFCDQDLAPSGLRDVTAPVADLARLDCTPRCVVVLENLETMLALPDLPGVVAVLGQGYCVGVLDQIPWVAGADVVYWGDLDTDGLNILSIARRHVPQVRSILMDRATLAAHLDLAVPDPRPRRSFAGPLTPSELDAAAALHQAGDVRLEQERVPWDAAMRALGLSLEPGCARFG